MNTHLIKNYIRHFFIAGNEHSLHSPFVFEFYNECLKNKSEYYDFAKIENERKKLLKDNKLIEIEDFGAGSTINNSKFRKINDIAKNSLKEPFLGKILFRIVNYLQPKSIIDIGTSLGITTSYLASSDKLRPIISFEGCKNTALKAKNTFQNLGLSNINLIEGEFSQTLPNIIKKAENLDFVFFDGNHQYSATIEYFNLFKERANENTCFIFDDIYWSEGMTKAWDEIKNHPDVMISIDTFYFGICFFRTNQPKQHFILR